MRAGLRRRRPSSPSRGRRGDVVGVGSWLRSLRRPATTLGPRRFRSILLAVDGAPSTRPAILWAGAIARACGAPVTLIAVAQPLVDPAGAFAEARRLLQGHARIAAEQVRQGEADQAILAQLRDGHDLLVVGAGDHGKPTFDGGGSTVRRLKASVPTSLLVARFAPRPGRLLCPVEGSDASRAAAEVALALGPALRMPIDALLVAGGAARPAWATGSDAFRLQEAAGAAAAVVAERAADPAVALTVMGARGPTPSLSWSPNGVSDLTLRRGGNVLVVRPPSA